jgi:hypothetical protein
VLLRNEEINRGSAEREDTGSLSGGLISALSESTVAGEEEVHMDEVSVVFGHQQEEREPVIDSEDVLLTGTSRKAS